MAELQRLLPDASIRERGEHLVISDHGGMMRALPSIAFAGARLGQAPRFGIDGHGDPGPLTTREQVMYRQFFDLIASWERIPLPPPNPPDPYPDWFMDRYDAGSLNPAPDGGGYPEDGDGLKPGDNMCKYLVCEPAVCGQPPIPPDGEFMDCGELQEELDELNDVIDYWNAQGQFWLDTVNYLKLAIQGKAAAEAGVTVAKMASALGLILSPEPPSTAAGIIVAVQTFADFAIGQLMDAIGILQ